MKQDCNVIGCRLGAGSSINLCLMILLTRVADVNVNLHVAERTSGARPTCHDYHRVQDWNQARPCMTSAVASNCSANA